MPRDSFIFYRSFYESIDSLPDDLQLELYKAISHYSLNFEELELSPITKAIWIVIKPNLDANIKRYENGKKPKKKQNGSKTEANNKQDEIKSGTNKDKDKDKDKDNDNIDYLSIVSYLNNKCHTQFRSTSAKTRKLIKARFNEGFKYEDFVKVIDNKTYEWLNNSDMNKYLRPETLFGTKFEGYLNETSVTSQEPVVNRSTEW